MFATSTTVARRKAVRAGLATAAIGAVTLGVAAPSAGATSVPPSSDGDVVVLDAGDLSQPVDLGARPAAGTAATNTSVSSVTGTLAVTGEQEQNVDLDVVTTVVESAQVTASDESGVTIRRRVESYDVTDNSSEDGAGESFASDEELAELVGVDLDYFFGPDNRLQDVVPADGVEVTDEQLAAIDEVIADGIDKAGLPAEPVGVGAQWTATLPGTNGGAAIEATYTLVSFADGQYTVEVSAAGDAASLYGDDLPRGFDEASGTIAGTGTLVGSVDEPLVRSVELELDLDVTLTGPTTEMTMNLTMTESEVSATA
jgi:hypothetical protein